MRLLVLGIISLVLIFIDQKTQYTQPARAFLSYLVTPFYWLARQPKDIYVGLDTYFTSRESLLEENERLYGESRILHAKVQRLASITAENVRLRELLGSSTVLEDSVMVAELLSVSPDPSNHQIVINKGAKQDVFVGQAVIDAYGLIGQVVEVNNVTARVILISDSRHAVPVQIKRNGVRAIIEGAGKLDRLHLPNLVETTDIKAGDLLVTSGLGQRFPFGYPVAVVESVELDEDQTFLNVVVRPSAKLDRSRYVLLVFKSNFSG